MKPLDTRPKHSLARCVAGPLGGSLLLAVVACSSETPEGPSGNVTTPTASPSGGGSGGTSAAPPPGAGAAPDMPSPPVTPPGPGGTSAPVPPNPPPPPPAASTSDASSGTSTASSDTPSDTATTSGATTSGATTTSGETSSGTGTGTQTTSAPDLPDPNADANPSGWPEPGEGGVAPPSGAAGDLQVLDWAGFAGAITYSFDDCTPSQEQLIDDVLALGVPFTFYLQTNQASACDTIANKALQAGGHELGNHTHSHEQDAATAGADTDQATQYIQDNYGITPLTMAAPFGNESVYAPVAQERFFINRGVGGGLMMPLDNTNRFNLKGPAPNAGIGADQFKAYVDGARDSGGWQVLTLHGFSDFSDWAYNPFPFDSFKQSVEYAKQLGDVWIGTVADIGAYWWGQKLLSEATPTASGDEQLWSWTLPDHFPPGRYLRVTIDGGTLSQEGHALPWNEHGFYEVSLDVGSLTLAP